MPYKQRGFTLAEMLIVISIIGMMAAAGAISLNKSLKRSRDARRISDIQAIRSALELYYQDHGQFPDFNTGSGRVRGWDTSLMPNWLDSLIPYMNSVPRDPINQVPSPLPGAFSSRPNGEFYYAYYRYLDSSHYGCYTNNIKNEIAVIAIKSFELPSTRSKNNVNAQCGVQPCDCLPDGSNCAGGGHYISQNNPNNCRDWGQEFDYSILVRG